MPIKIFSSFIPSERDRDSMTDFANRAEERAKRYNGLERDFDILELGSEIKGTEWIVTFDPSRNGMEIMAVVTYKKKKE